MMNAVGVDGPRDEREYILRLNFAFVENISSAIAAEMDVVAADDVRCSCRAMLL